MEYKRADRVADVLQRTIAELLYRRVRDPRLTKITITGVKLSDDLRYAKVFYCMTGTVEERDQAAAALDKATPFIRREVGQRVHMKYLPTLTFLYDESFDYGEKIERLLHELRHDE
ncbi:ribosome-binding factor A [Desulfacinum hydrothermale DSM 13146]|uniref:Ribosome-binding factor A n=1 Tax=Desulfacinum hydrothermale DSM 13146 TaxID=1121390 RepID=A0A1W1XA38_9BACT|nr:30S ribosome-binding factor RbfA [Desulfacinum hydrothermale]SMC20401.1 ribosome-binding factor A [Desulfacinum hydrothermale DSM 13146]